MLASNSRDVWPPLSRHPKLPTDEEDPKPVTSTRYTDLAALLRARPPRCGSARAVGIDGPSGSGKTMVGERLASALGATDSPVTVVHMDDLYAGWDGLAASVPLLVRLVLEPLAAGRPGSYRRWDWHRSAWGERVEVPVTTALVVEGCGCGSRDAAPYLSLLVWVDAPAEVRMRRGVERDGEAYRPHWERWARQEQALFAAEGTQDRADVIVDGVTGAVR